VNADTSGSVQSQPLPALRSRPRLFSDAQSFHELKDIIQLPWAEPYAVEVKRLADEVLDAEKMLGSINEHGHNWHLSRARHVQQYTWTLALEAIISGDDRYVRAVMQYVQAMHDWEYWSWIMWRAGNNRHDAIFDLSYGENSTTLAVLYDWLYDRLSSEDKALILATARRPVSAFLRYFRPQADGTMPPRPFWFEHKASNWNTVCAGGVGMLALSLAEHLPEAQEILQIVETSIRPYMENLVELNGAWPEGIGYWNYGMRYAFLYLLSHENATGQPHWALQQEATKQSLYFPIDFAPSGVACSFGDANGWKPLPFHHLVARRMGLNDLTAELFRLHPQLTPPDTTSMLWAPSAEFLLMVRPVAPDSTGDNDASNGPYIKLYAGQDWGILADRAHDPQLAMTVRGGTTEVPHGHIDLMSYHAVVKDEHLVYNVGINEYLDTTFCPRRNELYDVLPQSKNVVLINGLGVTHKSQVITRTIRPADGLAGFQIDATSAMGIMRDGNAVKQYYRSYLMIDTQALLVLDNILLPHEGRCESRLHTPMTPALDGLQASLQGKRQQGRVITACNHPARLRQALTLSTTPAKDDVHVLRLIPDDLQTHVAFATLLLPDELSGSVEIQASDSAVEVTVILSQQKRKWSFTSDLSQATLIA